MPRKSMTKDEETNANELTGVSSVNNRFSDVISKMEAETKKVEEKKNEEKDIIKKQNKSKKSIEKKYEINGKTKKQETKKKENTKKQVDEKEIKEDVKKYEKRDTSKKHQDEKRDTSKKHQDEKKETSKKHVKKQKIEDIKEEPKDNSKNIIKEKKADKQNKKEEKKQAKQNKKEEKKQAKENKKEKIEEIIEQEKQEIEENNDKLVKADINDLIKQKEELDTIKKEIKNQNKLPNDRMRGLYVKILKNSLLAIIFVIYFCIIVLDYTTIRPESFYTDIKALSILSIISTIIIFEIAYKRDSGKLAVRGIEFLLISISNVFIMYIYNFYIDSFVLITLLFGVAFVLYYLIKSFIVYKKDKKIIKKEIIKELNKEEG